MKKKNEIQTDSQTAAKGTIRIFFAISRMKGWKCMTTDIKAAFLQGRNIEHDVYMKPPIEERKEGKIWKIKKASCYDLNDGCSKELVLY